MLINGYIKIDRGLKYLNPAKKNFLSYLFVQSVVKYSIYSWQLPEMEQGCPYDVGLWRHRSEFKLQLHYYIHCWTNILGKSINPSFSQLCVK